MNFIKRISSILLFAVAIFALSCETDNTVSLDNTVAQDIVSKLQSAGFFTGSGLFKYNDGYIIEYDIFMTEKQIDQLINEQKGKKAGRTQQYRSTNLVTGLPRTIRVFMDALFNNEMQAAMDEALERYNHLELALTFVRTTDTATADIIILLQTYSDPRILGMSSGNPVGGNPATPIGLSSDYYNSTPRRTDAVSTIAHEIGHAIGFRHTDYMNRLFSCTNDYSTEPLTNAVHIPGTPTTPESNSWMLACSSNQDRVFTDSDVTALYALYQRNNLPFSNPALWYDGPNDMSNSKMLLGDVNGDNLPDLIRVQAADERFTLFLQHGFQPAFNGEIVGYDGPYDFSQNRFLLGDVNGDNKDDLVSILAEQERFSVFLGNSSGFNGEMLWYDGPYNFASSEFHLGDVNGDGMKDLISVNKQLERFSVFLSNGAGFNGETLWYDGPNDISDSEIRVGDLNGDNKADIARLRLSDERFTVFLNHGVTSQFNGEMLWHLGSNNLTGTQIELADINNDGKDDVVLINKFIARFTWFNSSGTGFNGEQLLYRGPYDYTNSDIFVKDINNNGYADIVSVDKINQYFTVFISDLP